MALKHNLIEKVCFDLFIETKSLRLTRKVEHLLVCLIEH